MTHTPGPWTVEQDLMNNGDIDIHAAESLAVAFINVREDSSDTENVPRETALANARLIAATPDHALLLAAIVRGVARWEFFTGSQDRGEVCVDGLRYSTELDEFGVPIITSHERYALLKAMEVQ